MKLNMVVYKAIKVIAIAGLIAASVHAIAQIVTVAEENVHVLSQLYYHYNSSDETEKALEKRIIFGGITNTEVRVLDSYSTAKEYMESAYSGNTYEFKSLAPISVNEESKTEESNWMIQMNKKSFNIRVSRSGDSIMVVYDGYINRFVNEFLSDRERQVLLMAYPSDSENIVKNCLTKEEKQFCSSYRALQDYMTSTYADLKYFCEEVGNVDSRSGVYEYYLTIQGKEYLFKVEKNNKEFVVSVDGYRTESLAQ